MTTPNPPANDPAQGGQPANNPPTDPPASPPANPPADPPAQDTTDWKAEARKWEDRSKANKAELDALRDGSKSEAEKIRDEAMAAARSELVRDRALMRFETEATKAGLAVDDVLDYVAIEKFIEDGTVKVSAIQEFVTKLAPREPAFKQGIGVGPQGGSAPTIDQRIADAEKAGDLRQVIALKREKARTQTGT